MFNEELKSIVFEALDNAVENEYDIEDDFKEAQDLLDQNAEVAEHFGISDEYPNQNDPAHVREVMKLVAEWKKLHNK